MAAVSNSSPLISYAAVDRLDLLQGVFGELFVPPAVWREVVTNGSGRSGTREVERADWIVQRPRPRQGPPTLVEALDPGEAEAIELAFSMQPGIEVLLDDFRARQVARQLGLRVVGSGGALLLAKDAGLIKTIRPILSDLRAAGLFLSERAIQELLSLADERETT